MGQPMFFVCLLILLAYNLQPTTYNLETVCQNMIPGRKLRPGIAVSYFTIPSPAQELQGQLGVLVGLGQDGGASLLLDVVLGHFSSFLGNVSIQNSRTSIGQVQSDILQVGNGLF